MLFRTTGALLVALFASYATAEEMRRLNLNHDVATAAKAVHKSLAEQIPPFHAEEHDEVELPQPKRGNPMVSIGFGGRSEHDTGNRPNLYNEVNPNVEVNFSPRFKVFGGRPVVGVGRVFDNSRKGTTDYVFVANEWQLVRGEYMNLCGGVGAMYAKYRDGIAKPGKRSSVEGGVPLVYGCVEFNKSPLQDLSVRVVPLGKDIIFYHFVYTVKEW